MCMMELATKTMMADSSIGSQRAVRGTMRSLLRVRGRMPESSRRNYACPELRSSGQAAYRTMQNVTGATLHQDTAKSSSEVLFRVTVLHASRRSHRWPMDEPL